MATESVALNREEIFWLVQCLRISIEDGSVFVGLSEEECGKKRDLLDRLFSKLEAKI